MRFGSVVLLTALFFVCGSALANPDFETMTTYYDTSGNVIGWYHARCNPSLSSSWGDTSGDIFTTSIIRQCGMAEFVSCSDVGLYQLNPTNCGDFWCVSEGYYDAYNDCMVPDCQGAYITPYCHTRQRVPNKKKVTPRVTAAVRPLFFETAAWMP